MIRETLDCSERQACEASVVDRSDDEADILLEMVSTWGSVQTQQPDWKEVRQLFFHLTESLKQGSGEESEKKRE